MDRSVDVAVIGAGHAGLNAIKEIRKQTDNYLLIDRGPLGTTCARVGCMPSKVAIHLAEILHQRHRFGHLGILGAEGVGLEERSALQHVRDLRDTFVDLVLANTTDEMDPDHLTEGAARFIRPDVLEVDGKRIHAGCVIIATGSASVVPQAWRQRLGQRLLTVEELFELDTLPESIAVIGMGPLGIELAQALSRLGVKVTGFERGPNVARLSDPEVNAVAIQTLQREFPIHTNSAAEVALSGDGVLVTDGRHQVQVDAVFCAMGRSPNLASLGLDALPVERDAAGVPAYDPGTLQVSGLPIYLAGDATGGIASLQIAAAQGQVAGHNACHPAQRTVAAKTPIHIIFTEPNIAIVGAAWHQLDPAQIQVGKRRFGPVGRAMIMGQNRGLLSVYAGRQSGRLLGAAMIGARCEHLAHLLAWAIQMEMTIDQALAMPFYHPVIEEVLQETLLEMQHAHSSAET